MPVEVYVEATGKRAFAGAIDWPGWCRAGRDEEAALEALFDYGARYAGVLKGSGVRFTAPARASTLAVVERLKGDATTDFGAPSIAPKADATPIDRRWLTKHEKILGRVLEGVRSSRRPRDRRARRKGRAAAAGRWTRSSTTSWAPRGGYLRMIAGKPPAFDEADAAAAREDERAAVLEGLERALTDGIPEKGPRGGARWSARYFVRRAAWHVLDHAWEIEDRSSAGG